VIGAQRVDRDEHEVGRCRRSRARGAIGGGAADGRSDAGSVPRVATIAAAIAAASSAPARAGGARRRRAARVRSRVRVPHRAGPASAAQRAASASASVAECSGYCARSHAIAARPAAVSAKVAVAVSQAAAMLRTRPSYRMPLICCARTGSSMAEPQRARSDRERSARRVRSLDEARRRGLAWGVHAFTASGAVVGAIALLAIGADNLQQAAILMLVALAIDSLDGTLARAAKSARCCPASTAAASTTWSTT
jgi:hypothetical protein